ncbi:oligosaccharyl transferase, archaeosortase A system-associated [Halalkalicoccus ordinarius]|uniref:oligosaccharyl transferase, archaeosortase A system-associated n=1 Tax=Halalkalicoccus ordinarius TaxID=3116651 RepID=UPI00300E6FC5
MGERTERADRTRGSSLVLEALKRWYHLPLLAIAMLFMFWVRVQSYDDFVFDDGAIRLRAVDSWYHWRTTMYTVHNWPATMPYDPWTAYPTGTYVGQFGTLFDQIIATVALIVGRGDPTQQTVFLVALLTVPALGALVVVPTYYIGARLGGRIGGLAGVVLLALFPGLFLNRTTTGMLQHHGAEVLFMSIAVLAMMVALRVAESGDSVYETIAVRDHGRFGRLVLYSVLAGLAITLYIWVWPPGIVLIGILGFFFVIELSVEFGRGGRPENLAFVGAVALGVTGALTLATMEVTRISSTNAGPLQPLLAFVVALGCAFMAWLARGWRRRGLDERYYPAAITGVIFVSIPIVALLLPELWGTIVQTVSGRLLPFGYSTTALTVQEAQPPDAFNRFVYRQYGLAFYTAMIGLAVLVARLVRTADHRSEHVLIVVWTLFLTSMAFTQIRFHYYYVVPIAVLNAYLIGWAIDRAGRIDGSRLRGIDGHQALVLLVLLTILVVPLMPPVAETTVVEAGQTTSPSRDAMFWKSSNAWLETNSPAPGAWGGADNEDELAYYGTYDVPEDRDFAYPEGSYGVMSWWDYGHLITVQAERIPHTNPFQQNASSAAAFLTADSEQRAELVLEALPAAAGGNPTTLEDGELAAIADERTAQQEDEEIRYVMIHDEMAGQKFEDITAYTDAEDDAYWSHRKVEAEVYEGTTTEAETETITAPSRNQAYADTTLSRLYHNDADGMEHYRLIHEDDQVSQFATVAVSYDSGESWQPLFLNEKVTAHVRETVSDLQEDPEASVAVYDVHQRPSVKTYERVEGARLTGSVDAPEGSIVTAEVDLTTTQYDRTFTYTQTARVDENGEFAMRVPYATEEDRGVEEGYTDSDVAADGRYRVSVEDESAEEDVFGNQDEFVGTAEVPESAIYDDETVEV